MSGFKSYYIGPRPIIGGSVRLEKAESHHLVGVLRAKKGEKVMLFDGKEGVWKAVLVDDSSKNVLLKIESEVAIKKPKCPVILAQAMPKGKGMDQILQKATEIGVSRIVPLQTARTELKLDKEREEKRIERWQAIVIEACKQSGNFLIPEVLPVQKLKAFIEECKLLDSLKLTASLEARAKPLKEYLKEKAPSSIIWLVGPEGDFTEEEYQLVYESGFQPISLAKNVLRVETAAIYALSITDYETN